MSNTTVEFAVGEIIHHNKFKRTFIVKSVGQKGIVVTVQPGSKLERRAPFVVILKEIPFSVQSQRGREFTLLYLTQEEFDKRLEQHERSGKKD